MSFDDQAFWVDFADNEGETYATETVPAQKLMVLFYEPVAVAA